MILINAKPLAEYQKELESDIEIAEIEFEISEMQEKWSFIINAEIKDRFNPYSPGFSIYFSKHNNRWTNEIIASILIHLDFLSI